MEEGLKNNFILPDVCSKDASGHPEIPLEDYHKLQPITVHPREWVQPTNRGDKRPRVVCNRLIQFLYRKYSQLPASHDDCYMRGEDVPFEEMIELKLEYQNILHIENIEKCQNLKKLSLSNNIIETPVGLGSLRHLEELDLSYNKLIDLKTIQLLRKLKVLRLNNNLLRNISLLRYNHRSLEVLSLGWNKLNDFLETLLFLSSLPNLKSLTLDGNPFWGEGKETDKSLKIVLFNYLPQLRFYEHRIITFSDCYPSSSEMHEADEQGNEEERRLLVIRRVLNSLKNEDPHLIDRLVKIRDEILTMDANEEEAQNKLGLESVLEQLCLSGFRYGKGFNAMMETDPEGQELMSISKRVKDEVFTRLEESMEPVIHDITRTGITFFRSRQECIDRFVKQWDDLVEAHVELYSATIEKFLKEEKVVEAKLLAAFNSDNGSEDQVERNMKEILLYDKEFIILTKKLWWDLMEKEMAVHAKLEDMFEVLDETLVEMIREYVEPFQEKVAKLRKVEEEFFEYLMEFMSHYVNELVTSKWERSKLSNHHKKMIFNSEARTNMITQCHDNHTTFIDIEEEDAVDQLKKWQLHVAESCRRIEFDNNRKEVDGIQRLIVERKSEWEDKTGEAIRSAYTFLWVIDPRWTREIMYFKMNFEERRIFDKMEDTVKTKTLHAIKTRRELERNKALAEAKEAGNRAEIERKMHMRRLRSLVEQPLAASPPPMIKSDKEKAKELASKEMAVLNEIDVPFDVLRRLVLQDEYARREVNRKKREREWKTRADISKLVHLTGGNNLKTYQALKEKILHSDGDGSM